MSTDECTRSIFQQAVVDGVARNSVSAKRFEFASVRVCVRQESDAVHRSERVLGADCGELACELLLGARCVIGEA